MRFHADLHVHSKYSRATSRDLDLEHVAAWCGRKGIAVVATGDFTHPAWAAELKAKLEPAEPGLFRLAAGIEKAVAEQLPAACRTPVRFMLAVEISTIYKKGERTRKIHHLIYAPDIATVDRISARLARIGNIASDGRPILGLDSRDLLEITLEVSPDAYLVPAHIWTPWFAALGSQSGFDSIAECYGDLTDHIFALETGLSSDPPMNWRLSMLDRYRLTSNSDAHSPGKLGREATTFDCAVDYFAIRDALKTGRGYVGTVEFFPDEGKYHLDGHRKCGVRLTPSETQAHGGRCPVCGHLVTVGVEHRVEALADRGEAGAVPPPTAGEVANLVPLPEVLGELTASGPATKTVEQGYHRTIAALGSELSILQQVPLEDIARAGSPLLAEAIARLRAGRVIREPGYDGEYGVIRLFAEGELERATAGGLLFEAPTTRRRAKQERSRGAARTENAAMAADLVPRAPRALATPYFLLQEGPTEYVSAAPDMLAGLDAEQRAAATIVEGPLLIVAGPGSGKTRTLTHRFAHMIAERGVSPASCLAVTFTRRAAAEMRERLARLIPDGASEVAVPTFHSLGLAILREHPDAAGLSRAFRIAPESERAAALGHRLGVSEVRALRLLREISQAKRTQAPMDGELADALSVYGRVLALHDWVDFDDLIGLALRALEDKLAGLYRARFSYVAVDEFQDIDAQQYRLLTLIAPPPGANLCAIGDADQAIYGFRGADSSCFKRFRDEYSPRMVELRRNYRSSGTIVAASTQLMGGDEPLAKTVRDMAEHITIHVAPTDKAEAEFVIQTVEGLLGGHTSFSIDSGRGTGETKNLSFADIAVLYRTEAQAAALSEAFARSGMPFKRHSHEGLSQDPAAAALTRALDAASEQSIPDQLHAAAARLRGGSEGFDPAAIDTALDRLLAIAQACGADHARFRDAVALTRHADLWDAGADRVSLLTLHAAKGLEFPVVFIVGLEDGILPLHWGEPDEAAIAEEQRLFYVGMTRAEDRLFLSRALSRPWRGRVRRLPASPFLSRIEDALVRHHRAEGLRRKPEDRQLKLF
jgi:uncharacterized protein (TIGR00375 family)